MKIEPFENNSIKVTLDSEDLEHFGIDLHRDAYGSPRMEQLFRRIGSKLRQEQGFNPDGLPVAIEAIPVNVQQLVLNFIPVPYAEEAGNGYAHFSKLSPEDEAMGLYGADTDASGQDAAYDDTGDDFANDDSQEDSYAFRTSSPFGAAFSEKDGASRSGAGNAAPAISALAVTFKNFQEAATACSVLPAIADRTESWMFRMGAVQTAASYILFIRASQHKNAGDSPDFREIARILSEYGRVAACAPSRLDYYLEHGTCLIREEAIRRLRKFS
jgi:adapter protein MecA 1/2